MLEAVPGLLRCFQQEALRVGIPLNDDQIAQFHRYLLGIKEWNRVVRLVSNDQPENLVWLHFMDSLSPYPYVGNDDALLDIGSGAGFPGLPLKIAKPTIRLHLVEARRRKVHFLKHTIRSLDLTDTIVHPRRLRTGDPLGPYETIISRALSPPSKWLPLAAPFLSKHGQIILMLGPQTALSGLQALLDNLGLQKAVHVEFQLPILNRRRRLLVVRRAGCFT